MNRLHFWKNPQLATALKKTMDLGCRYIPLRRRYLLTRDNRLRLRYVVPSVAVCGVLGLSALTSFPSDSQAVYIFDTAALNEINPEAGYSMADADAESESDADPVASRQTAMQRRLNRYQNDPQGHVHLAAATAPAAQLEPLEPLEPREKEVAVGQGDTLSGVLEKAGIGGAEAHQITKALEKHYNPRNLRPGQKLFLTFEPAEDGSRDYSFAALNMPLGPVRSVELSRLDDGSLASSIIEKSTETQLQAGRAEIEVSLYGSAARAGIPSAIVAELIRIYSWDVDFQRDVRRGDAVEVLYERVQTPDGDFVKNGDIVYARLLINGHDIAIYRFETEDGEVDYFTADGKSIRKALMRTPVDGARISSGFGMRRHPVLGYSRMHRGMDFAAPTGTPIYAAGDGTIEKAAYWGSYGNYIRIRHNNNTKTAYAHLHRFGKGMREGQRVRQGDVIGYVGATGTATGPHLHYEVIIDGEHVNPASIKTQDGPALAGKQLAAFKAHVNKVNREYAALSGKQKLASAR